VAHGALGIAPAALERAALVDMSFAGWPTEHHGDKVAAAGIMTRAPQHISARRAAYATCQLSITCCASRLDARAEGRAGNLGGAEGRRHAAKRRAAALTLASRCVKVGKRAHRGVAWWTVRWRRPETRGGTSENVRSVQPDDVTLTLSSPRMQICTLYLSNRTLAR